MSCYRHHVLLNKEVTIYKWKFKFYINTKYTDVIHQDYICCIFQIYYCRHSRCADLLYSGWLKAFTGSEGLSRKQQEVQWTNPAACRSGVHQSRGRVQVTAWIVVPVSLLWLFWSLMTLFCLCSDGRESSTVTKVFSVQPADLNPEDDVLQNNQQVNKYTKCCDTVVLSNVSKVSQYKLALQSIVNEHWVNVVACF